MYMLNSPTSNHVNKVEELCEVYASCTFQDDLQTENFEAQLDY